MPKYVTPQTSMPGRVVVVTEILGLPALRVEIFRYLSLHSDGATTGEIAAHLNVPYPTVRRNLEQLEQLGAVVASDPPPRGGKHVVFALVPGTLRRAIEEAERYMRGTP